MRVEEYRYRCHHGPGSSVLVAVCRPESVAWKDEPHASRHEQWSAWFSAMEAKMIIWRPRETGMQYVWDLLTDWQQGEQSEAWNSLLINETHPFVRRGRSEENVSADAAGG